MGKKSKISMKAEITKSITLIFISISLSFGQTTYTWVGGNSGNFTTAANWSPIRLNGQVTDILIFNTGSLINVNNVQQQTVGQLKVKNNTHVVLTPASGNPKAIYINGGNGDDLVVDSNSILEIYANTPQLGIYLNNGATAGIYGSVIIRGQQAHYIDAENSKAIKFHGGSVLIQNSPGYIFTNSGTTNAVVFEDGSEFIMQNPTSSSPFGLNSPASKVNFNPNSTFIMQTSNNSALSLNGRTYGNFILDMNSTVQASESFTSNVTFNGITIKVGTSLNISNSNSNFNPELNINGDLDVEGNLSFTNNLKINFSGSNLQTIEGNGTILFPSTLTSINFINPAGITLTKDLNVPCPVNVNTNLSLINIKLTANVSLTGNSSISVNNGYIIGSITKYFSNSSNSHVFEVGTDNGYSPVTITFNNITQPGYLTVKATASVHPLIQDSTSALKRYWSFTNNGIISSSYSAIFNYLSCDFNSNFIESRDEATMTAVNLNGNFSTNNNSPIVNYRDTLNNEIGITKKLSFGDFTFIKQSITSLNSFIPGNNQSLNLESKTNDSKQPNEFRISQNYPNPFNPSTKINYELPNSSNVTIKIFDINGREVKTLVNNFQEAGNYTVEFNAQNISSGIYFYKIIATDNHNTFEKTLKMILTK